MTSYGERDGEPDPAAPELLEAGGEAPRLSERWAALPHRTRLAVRAALAAALLVAAGGYALASRPGAPPPVPWPGAASHIGYAGIAEAPDPADRSVAFALRAEATKGTPVTIEAIHQGYDTLELSVSPRLPITLSSGHPRRLVVRMTVLRCSGVPIDARLPFLDVTLRNDRAIQDVSEILGEAYADDLSRSLRTICDARPSPSSPTS
ncbi:hypothetical protein [Streptomyces sp. 8N616]|uniref:hypothetical protein n=1 Tax=Streptomyces sp. 8N616 TaxID=3457414 RepID=UPI003FD421B1